MRKIFLIVLFALNLTHAKAQKEELTAGAVGAGIAIFAAAAAYDAFIEKLENEATEWVLLNRPDCNRFRLKIMNLRGEKLTNMSEISSCTFMVEPVGSEKFVMMWIVSDGWWNDYGVVFSKLAVRTFTKMEWSEIVWGFFQCGTGYMKCTPDSIPVYSPYDLKKTAEHFWNNSAKQKPSLTESSFQKVISDERNNVFYALRDITNFNSLLSVKGNKFDFYNPSNLELPITIDFEKMDGDTYVVKDVKDLRVIYNERSINIFFKSINSLVKFRNTIFSDITKELLELR